MWSYGLSFVAGTITFLSPCVLPVLPILVGSAGREHRYGPVALAAGLVASFVAVGVLVTFAGAAIGLDGASVRAAAAIPLLIMGLILLSSRMQGDSRRRWLPWRTPRTVFFSNPSLPG